MKDFILEMIIDNITINTVYTETIFPGPGEHTIYVLLKVF